MAELILRPVSDSTLAHSCSSGSSGWALINEAAADDDTGYIYQSISGTSSSSQTSVFKVSGTVSNKIRISSLNLVIRGRTTKGNDKDTATLAYNVYFNGVEGSGGSGTFSTSYGNFSKTYNASDFGLANTIFDSFDAANIVVHVLTTGAKNASKNDDFQNRVTQVYLTATYEEITNPTYACSAVTGEGIQSASVSASPVISGESCTFTATLKSNYNIFDGWYSDSGCANLVSTANPYTTAITADTTLYAKASRSSYTMTVGEAEHGTASVSSATALYGDSVTYTFTPEDDTWELYGWYSDSGLTTLVSEANPYTFTATNDATLYPKVGIKQYTITYGKARNLLTGGQFSMNVIVVDFDSLTRDEVNCLRTGNYNNIGSSKVVASDSINESNVIKDVWKTIQCPCNMYVAVYIPEITASNNYYGYVTDGSSALTYWPYYWFRPTANATISFTGEYTTKWCNCSAVAKDGVAYAHATTPTLQEKQAVFEAELSPGYSFQGWYSDEACTTLVSSNNPYKPTTPKYTTDSASATSLTLYAKAQKTTYNIRVHSASSKCEMTLNNSTSNSVNLYYGDTATVSCSIESSLYEFSGWYSDCDLTQLVGTDATYSFTVTESVDLYAGTRAIGDYNTITIGRPFYDASVEETDGSVHGFYTFYLIILISDYYKYLSSLQKYYLSSGDVSSFGASVGWSSSIFANIYSPMTYQLFSDDTSAAHFADFQCPTGCTALIWAYPSYESGESKSEDIDSSTDGLSTVIYKDGVRVSNGNSYYFTPTGDTTITSRSYPLQSFGRVSSMALVSGTEENPSTSPAISWCDPSEYPKFVYTGSTETFSAQLVDGYSFEGWYTKDSDGNYALCSTDNPFTTTVTFGTGNHDYVLYSKISKDTYTISVGAAEHCTASVSTSTAQYGDSVTFSCTPDSGYEFKGWYADEEYAQLLSDEATYSFVVTGNITIYPKVQAVEGYYVISIGRPLYDASGGEADDSIHGEYFFTARTFKYDDLSLAQKYCLDSGDFKAFGESVDGTDLIQQAQTVSGNDTESEKFVSIQCPIGCTLAVWGQYASLFPASENIDSDTDFAEVGWPIIYKDGVRVSDGCFYCFTPESNATITSRSYPIQSFGRVSSLLLWTRRYAADASELTAVASWWTPTYNHPQIVYTGSTVSFTAQVADDFSDSGIFTGWYTKDSAGNYALYSTDNPLTTTVTFETGIHDVLLYGAIDLGIYLKKNGTYSTAIGAYKKVNGAWEFDPAYCKSLLSQKDRKGTIVKMV